MKMNPILLVFTTFSTLFFLAVGIKGIASASLLPQDTCRTLVTRLGNWCWVATCTGGCGQTGGTCKRCSEPGSGGTWYYCRCKWVDQSGEGDELIPNTDCTAKVLVYPAGTTLYPHVDCYRKNCSANCRPVDPSKMEDGSTEDACLCPDD